MKIVKNAATIMIVIFCNIIIILSLLYCFGTIDEARYQSSNKRIMTILSIEAELAGEEYGCLFDDDPYHYVLKVRVRNDGNESITSDNIHLKIYTDDSYRYFPQEYENKYNALKSQEFVPEGKTGIVTKVIGSTQKDGFIYVAAEGENDEEVTFKVEIP